MVRDFKRGCPPLALRAARVIGHRDRRPARRELHDRGHTLLPSTAGAGGTMYQVSRRAGGSGPFAQIGGTGVRSFVDDTVPAGTAAVTYQIRAVRSTTAGVAAQFVVNFGVGGGGEMTASVVTSSGGSGGPGGAPKLAA